MMPMLRSRRSWLPQESAGHQVGEAESWTSWSQQVTSNWKSALSPGPSGFQVRTGSLTWHVNSARASAAIGEVKPSIKRVRSPGLIVTKRIVPVSIYRKSLPTE